MFCSQKISQFLKERYFKVVVLLFLYHPELFRYNKPVQRSYLNISLTTGGRCMRSTASRRRKIACTGAGHGTLRSTGAKVAQRLTSTAEGLQFLQDVIWNAVFVIQISFSQFVFCPLVFGSVCITFRHPAELSDGLHKSSLSAPS